MTITPDWIERQRAATEREAYCEHSKASPELHCPGCGRWWHE